MPRLLRGWRRWVLLGLLLVVAGAGLLAGHVYVFATSPFNGKGDSVLTVPEGTSYNRVVGRLVESGWLPPDQSREMKVLGRILGVTAGIHAGEYRVTRDMTPMGLLDRLVGGEVIQHRVTLPEGWTVRRFLQRLAGHEALDASALPDGPKDSRLLEMLGLKEQDYSSAEGWLFPDTYRFPRSEGAAVILAKSHRRMREILQEEWGRRQEDLAIDRPYQALILASIVEKETAVPEERPMIAGVFMNRLREGMRLQTDPTVIYGLGKAFDGNLQTRHLERRDPYNTYRIRGLPPTPIANPGRKAIRAACNPADTDALYFVARGDGSHVFSETLAEHNRAVRRYQLGGGP